MINTVFYKLSRSPTVQLNFVELCSSHPGWLSIDVYPDRVVTIQPLLNSIEPQ